MPYGRLPRPISPRIVRGHPLARDLVAFWAMNERGGTTLTDLVAKKTISYSTNDWHQTRYGISPALWNTHDTFPTSEIASSPFTILYAGEGPTDGDDIDFWSNENIGASGSVLLSFASGNANTHLWTDSNLYIASLNYGYVGGPIIIHSVYNCFPSGTGTLQTYVNGIPSPAVTVADTYSQNDDEIQLGGRHNSFSPQLPCYAFGAWTRALKPQEIESQVADLHSVVRPRKTISIGKAPGALIDLGTASSSATSSVNSPALLVTRGIAASSSAASSTTGSIIATYRIAGSIATAAAVTASLQLVIEGTFSGPRIIGEGTALNGIANKSTALDGIRKESTAINGISRRARI